MRCGDRFSEAVTRNAYQSIASLADVLEEKRSIEVIAEQTALYLNNLHRFITSVNQNVNTALEIIENCDIDSAIDPDGTTIILIEKSEETYREAIEAFDTKRKYAFSDNKLNGEHERLVISAYSSAIEALKNLHDASSKFRWTIMERDSEIEPASKERFSNVSDLLRAITER